MHDDIFNPIKKNCDVFKISNASASAAENMDYIQWLSQPEVKKAFHVLEKVTNDYIPLSFEILTSYKSAWEASIWIYDIFLKNGYKIMHMMGDVDGMLTLPGAW
jgi:hypothetical protein